MENKVGEIFLYLGGKARFAKYPNKYFSWQFFLHPFLVHKFFIQTSHKTVHFQWVQCMFSLGMRICETPYAHIIAVHLSTQMDSGLVTENKSSASIIHFLLQHVQTTIQSIFIITRSQCLHGLQFVWHIIQFLP